MNKYQHKWIMTCKIISKIPIQNNHRFRKNQCVLSSTWQKNNNITPLNFDAFMFKKFFFFHFCLVNSRSLSTVKYFFFSKENLTKKRHCKLIFLNIFLAIFRLSESYFSIIKSGCFKCCNFSINYEIQFMLLIQCYLILVLR